MNGSLPTDASCARAGIDEVEVVFSNADGTGPVHDAALKWPCANGYYESGTTRVLTAGSFAYRWVAYRGTESVLQSKLYEYSIAAGEELTLMPVDFERHEPIEVDVSLTFGADVGSASCAGAMVDQGMSWALHSGGVDGPIVASSNGTFGCSDSIAIRDMPVGTLVAGPHTLEVIASATDGAAWSGTCAVEVPDGGPVSVTCDVPRSP